MLCSPSGVLSSVLVANDLRSQKLMAHELWMSTTSCSVIFPISSNSFQLATLQYIISMALCQKHSGL